MSQPDGPAFIDRWTGRHAIALQAALRYSQDEMASKLGFAKRTIASWAKKPTVVIRPELQRALDTEYQRAPEEAKLRFARQLKVDDDAEIAASGIPTVSLTVAIAVVLHEADVLVVCRREPERGLDWQFPAGIVKLAATASTVAVRETLAETGIHCAVRSGLGARIHPLTRVNCHYFRCDYVAGTVENRDTVENVEALWAPRHDIGRFIPAQRIYEPVLRAIEEPT